jgi:hypothetical protein
MTRNILLVEGSGDKWFFISLLEKIGVKVDVFPPKDPEIQEKSKGNGADGALAALEKHLGYIKNGQIDNLGIVVDADFIENKLGYVHRHKQVSDILSKEGFFATQTNSLNKGDIFQRTDAPSIKIGLWIMPDHSSPGMIENLLLDSINTGLRKELLEKNINDAIKSLDEMEEFKKQSITFNPTHIAKVRFNTWLTWQRKPENCRFLTPACALKEGWLNPDNDNIKALTTWLTRVFQ